MPCSAAQLTSWRRDPPLLFAGAREDLGKHLLLEREQSEAVAELGLGGSNKQIAAKLGVSPNAVGTQVRSMFAKLQERSRVQLSIQSP
ncbi:response regulator transcription factor [Streptomyces sp. uw30]|uniref:response regulator transcription factor n=1 Tax=Streptomyces sp. uw30 TaxID=1828179 RepID=UPI003966E328